MIPAGGCGTGKDVTPSGLVDILVSYGDWDQAGQTAVEPGQQKASLP